MVAKSTVSVMGSFPDRTVLFITRTYTLSCQPLVRKKWTGWGWGGGSGEGWDAEPQKAKFTNILLGKL